MTRRVLIVEDDEAVRGLCRRALESEGFEVFEAGEGRTALLVFERERPQLVITDLRMPRMDGLQTLTHFCRHHPEVPVVAISSGDNRTFLDMALAFGAAEALEKPFTVEQLLGAVRQALASPPDAAEGNAAP